jgi:hypothetical protein
MQLCKPRVAPEHPTCAASRSPLMVPVSPKFRNSLHCSISLFPYFRATVPSQNRKYLQFQQKCGTSCEK